METLSFTTKLEVQPITIDGDEYEIREMTSMGRDSYLKSLNKTMKVRMVSSGEKDDGGNEVMRREIEITDLSGAQKELLLATMVRVKQDGKREPITLRLINEWGAKMVERLAKAASDLNGLEQPDNVQNDEAEKN